MEQRILFAVLLSLISQAGSLELKAEALNSRKGASAKILEKNRLAQGGTPAGKATGSPQAKTPEKAAGATSTAAAKPQETEDPNFVAALNKGIELYNKNKCDEALVELQKALEISKNNTAVRNWLGATYQKLNKFPEAAAIYEEVVQLDPDYAEAHNNLAFSYQQMQDYEKAEPEYKKAVDLKPGFLEAHFNLACVLQLEKKNDEAIKEFETVLQMDPSRTDCFLRIGDMAKQNKDYEKALQYYDKAKDALKGKKDPDSEAAILCAIALIDKEKGDKAKCKDGLERVLDLNPGSYEALLNMGIIQFEDKDFTGSLDYLGKALQRNPYDAAVHFWLGRYYYSLDSMKNSIKQFNDCLKCDALEHKFPECQEWLNKAKAKQATF
ncbi:MAG: tetratricopeptide repeat protein [Candidatus Obscuribacterales bacterium]|nr:tetratricopeptide repeat protein [Candidatus Obscuribacterales bacterium]